MTRLILIILFSYPFLTYCQWIPSGLRTSYKLSENDSNMFTVNVEITGFFKNNEYFSPLAKGETFPGIMARPSISYQLDKKLLAEFGMTGLYYSGDQQKDGTYIFNGISAKLQYMIKPSLIFIFGNYYGGVNHRLAEPLYKWERHLTSRPESGLQLLYEDKKYFADIWLNWQRFITRGDPLPEVLTFGISCSAVITGTDKNFILSVPVQTLIYHQGGQIDVSEEKMIVAGNIATGICSEYKFNNIIKSAGIDLYVIGYYDKTPDEQIRPYNRGFGYYPVIRAEISLFEIMVGYWHANKFFSFEGEPLFASFNPDYPGLVLPSRKMITTKLSFTKELHKTLNIGIQLETYYDFKRHKTDYSFGTYLRFCPQFFSRKL